MEKNNKKIFLNTGVMYVRLIVVSVIGLLTSRIVLQALGANNYGLYAVVGGLISMLNVLSTAMYTTTRRYINVEMGKKDGRLNEIFNISRLIHIGFAVLIFVLAETIGLYYIYNYLNISPDKFSDAIFVFHVSTIAAAFGIINVPYQALMEAYEKFTQIAIIDIIRATLKLCFVFLLLYYNGNALRFYAMGMSILTIFTLLFYNLACYFQWKETIRYRFYRGRKQYKDILFFNNFIALGAFSYISRSQASTLLVNFFFGTLVNAAFAIAYEVENYCILLINNVGAAAGPQVTQNFSGNYDRSIWLTIILNRISICFMILVFVPLYADLGFLLECWLKDVPEGTLLICHLTLISALIRVIIGGTATLVQASGKVKWFQTTGTIIELLSIPVSYILFKIGYDTYWIIIVYTLCGLTNRVVSFYLMKRILRFDVYNYIKRVYIPTIPILIGITAIIFLYENILLSSFWAHLAGMCCCLLATMSLIIWGGMNKVERNYMFNFVKSRFNKL